MDQVKFEQMEIVIFKNYFDGSVGVFFICDFFGIQSFVVQYQCVYKKIFISEVGLNYMGMNVFVKVMEFVGIIFDLCKVWVQFDVVVKVLLQFKIVYKVFGVMLQGYMDVEFLIVSVKGGKYIKLCVDKIYK